MNIRYTGTRQIASKYNTVLLVMQLKHFGNSNRKKQKLYVFYSILFLPLILLEMLVVCTIWS
jgi:hypothetical protein